MLKCFDLNPVQNDKANLLCVGFEDSRREQSGRFGRSQFNRAAHLKNAAS